MVFLLISPVFVIGYCAGRRDGPVRAAARPPMRPIVFSGASSDRVYALNLMFGPLFRLGPPPTRIAKRRRFWAK
jgi:hypothetical protein